MILTKACKLTSQTKTGSALSERLEAATTQKPKPLAGVPTLTWTLRQSLTEDLLEAAVKVAAASSAVRRATLLVSVLRLVKMVAADVEALEEVVAAVELASDVAKKVTSHATAPSLVTMTMDDRLSRSDREEITTMGAMVVATTLLHGSPLAAMTTQAGTTTTTVSKLETTLEEAVAGATAVQVAAVSMQALQRTRLQQTEEDGAPKKKTRKEATAVVAGEVHQLKQSTSSSAEHVRIKFKFSLITLNHNWTTNNLESLS